MEIVNQLAIIAFYDMGKKVERREHTIFETKHRDGVRAGQTCTLL